MLSLPMIISWSADGRSLIRESASTKNILEKIFEPFTQENMDARSVYHGTGLGMSIAKALFEQMVVPLRFPVLRVSEVLL